MFPHLAVVLIVHLWLALHSLKINALAVAPQGFIVTALNRTDSSSTFNLTVPPILLNNTLIPSQNAISYRVPNTPTSLLFHSFGATIPTNDILRANAFALSIALDHVKDRQGRSPIVTGIFVYTHEFLDQMKVEFTVTDFREAGRPMTYYVLCDTLRGIGEFALLQGPPAKEVSFEVDVRDVGYVGTGHVDYLPVAPSSSAVV